MTIEVRPLNLACNLACIYCYQNDERYAGNNIEKYDISSVISHLEKAKQPFAVFGGEPLLLCDSDLEALFSLGYKHYKRNIIQTNGTLVSDSHIQMFKKYNVHVGVSMDGPGEFNDLRRAKDLNTTRKAAEKSQQALENLCKEKISTCLIITLHRQNATKDKIPVMCKWLRDLAKKGLHHVRLHTLEADDPLIREKYGLSPDESFNAMLAFAKLGEPFGKKFIDVFNDITSLLLGDDTRTTCIWRNCDFYHSKAVGILGQDGEIINCGHTHKDGIGYLKSDTIGYERYTALYNTKQENGGCKGCRFFIVCKGWCPASGLGHDWRNRTMHCDMWKKVFNYFEQKMLSKGEIPVSVAPNRAELEKNMLDSWGKREKFVRYAWKDYKTRQIWEQRLKQTEKAWKQIESESVILGMRKCALIRGSMHDFQQVKRRLKYCIDIDAVKVFPVSSLYWEETSKFSVDIAICRSEYKKIFIEACEKNDHKKIGKLLGYPLCCIDFYQKICSEEKKIDTTWEAALNAGNKKAGSRIEIAGSPNTNFLLYKMNLKLTAHLPCSFDCYKSLEISKQFISLGKKLGYAKEMDWLYEILSMKMEWSALHGIAEIKTPLFKMTAKSDVTDSKKEIFFWPDITKP